MSEKVNQYVVELWHEPSMSPLSNMSTREQASKAQALLPILMKQRGMKMVGSYHLDPEHRAILVFEAKSVEDVRDVLYECGYMHFCDGRIFPCTPLAEMHKWVVENTQTLDAGKS